MRKAALLCLLSLAACAHLPGTAPARPAFAIDATAVEPLPPITLDANDGTAMDLRQLSISVEIHGPITQTSVHAVFVNPSPRDMEGRFRFVMPPRSSISRLAMKIGNEWREAEAAETSAARETYEQIIHRRRDPLLVEQPREREIAARIAPIWGGETKEVRLEYTSEVGADRPIVVPLRGLPAVPLLEVSIIDGITEPVHFYSHLEKPTADVRYALPTAATARSGGIVAMRVKADFTAVAQPLDHPIYLVDTSASADLEAAQSLLSALPPGRVIAYDQTAAYLINPSTDLRARGALGLANLGPALELAKTSGATRIVVLGGGRIDDAKPLPASIERVDVLGSAPTVDARVLRSIARRGLVIEDAALLERAETLRRLTNRVQDAPIAIPGATWQSTDRLLAASPGEERVVFAQTSPAQSDLDLTIEHAFAAAKVEQLVAQGLQSGFSDAAKRDVIALGRKHRLATPFTSLIVLENDVDVARLRWNEAHTGNAPPPPLPPPAPSRTTRGHVAKPPALRMGSVAVNGRLPPEVIQRIIRMRFGVFQGCYLDGQRRDPHLAGRVTVKFVIGRDGHVLAAEDGGSEVKDRKTIECMVNGFRTTEFPIPEGGIVTVVYPIMLSQEQEEPQKPVPLAPLQHKWFPPKELEGPPAPPTPWSDAYVQMRAEPARAPRTPIGFVALGEALEAKGDLDRAARAYASLAEMWPERAELSRAAAVRLDHLHAGDPLAITLLRRAIADRPDHPSGHHLLGLTLLRAGDKEGARAAFKAGLARRYELRYAGALDLLRADLAMLDSTDPISRVSLAWETDTSDLDVFVESKVNGRLNSAPIAYAADGYGPEAMDPVRWDGPGETHLTVALNRRGMGGDVLGAVHVIKRNERGDISVEPRPFEIMTEGAALDLGRY